MRNTVISRSRLLALLNGHDQHITEAEEERRILLFCINCPDPLGALHAVLEAPRGTSDHEILEQALALPPRILASYSFEELPTDHPLRHLLRSAL